MAWFSHIYLLDLIFVTYCHHVYLLVLGLKRVSQDTPYSSPFVLLAQSRMHAMSRRMAEFHKKYDILLTPGLGHMPPKLGWIDMMLDDDDEYWNRVALFSPFTVWFNPTYRP